VDPNEGWTISHFYPQISYPIIIPTTSHSTPRGNFELAPRLLVGCVDPSFPIAAPHSLFANRSRGRGQKLSRRGIASRTTVVVLGIDPVFLLVLYFGMKMDSYLRGCSVRHGSPALCIHDVCEHRVLEHDARQNSPRSAEVHLPNDTSPRGSGNLLYVRNRTDAVTVRLGGPTVLWSKT
jgi:hypothetical protein